MSNRRDPDDDLYSTLGVPAGATGDEITRAYRRLAREHHPDANPDAEADRFAGLTDAYDILRDPDRRRAYDDTRTTRARAARAASGMRIPVHHVGATPAEPAATSEVEIALTFEQAALGTTVVVPIRTRQHCPDCAGSGRGPAMACPSCRGQGATVRQSGGITIRTSCDRCHGTGAQSAPRCSRCAGSGVADIQHDVTVRVPAGVEAGARLRLRIPDASTLEVTAAITVAPHPYFARRGDDLLLPLPVTLAEAALGTVVSIPTLTGAVAIRIPAGTPHGRVLRVRAHGIAAPGRRPGDLLATVELVVPAKLTDAQRAALEAFAAATTQSPRAHFALPTEEHRP